MCKILRSFTENLTEISETFALAIDRQDVLGSRKLQGAKVSKNFRSRERKGRAISLQGAKVPGSKFAKERIGQGPIGRFAPGSELARERKDSTQKYGKTVRSVG